MDPRYKLKHLQKKLSQWKRMRRKETDKMQILQIEEKIDEIEEKIEKLRDDEWYQNLDEDDYDDDDDDDDDHFDDNDKGENSKNNTNIFLYLVLLVGGFLFASYYVYLNTLIGDAISETMKVFNTFVFLIPAIYFFVYPVRRTSFQIFLNELFAFLVPFFIGVVVGMNGSFCYFFYTFFPNGLDWPPLFLMSGLLIFSVILFSISGCIDIGKFVPDTLLFFSVYLYLVVACLAVLMILGSIFFMLENYFRQKRKGPQGAEINFVQPFNRFNLTQKIKA